MKKYKLIKWYPSLGGRLGVNDEVCLFYNKGYNTLDDKLGRQLSKEEVENNPEFWEEVEYEVLSYSTPVTIFSVKRLSDNEVFTVDDKIRVKWKNGVGIIESIYYNEHKQLSFKIKGYEAPLVFVFSEDSPEKVEVLFTTEDGVKITDDDAWVWGTNNKSFTAPTKTSVLIAAQVLKGNDNFKYFSTEDAAKGYILINKPCLSLKDVNDTLKEFWEEGKINTGQYVDLKKLVKSKLKLV